MKKIYEQPKLTLRIYTQDVVTASAVSLGEDDFGQEDIFYD